VTCGCDKPHESPIYVCQPERISGSFSLAYQQHSLGPSNSSQQQQASSSRESNVQTGTTTLRSRHRSSHHDGLIKCHYCPKKWADQAVVCFLTKSR
ncbi:unnamed protein product, partial [Onchocerca flexuosa]|uniref:Uncharacterized protein n=1 Tax=Onchocerca flexuosa TaxID=387005 RepID=A0A183HE81_9BILA